MDYDKFLKQKLPAHMPSGFEVDIETLNDNVFDWQKILIKWALFKGKAALFESCGLGKAQSVNDEILTPNGWEKIGDAQIGDDIYGSDGQIHKITGVYPQGIRELYEFKFSDNTVVNCDYEHLWAVYTQSQLYNNTKYTIKTAKEIYSCGLSYKGGQKKNFIPLNKPIQFKSKKELPIDSYTFGVILGDGCIVYNTPIITTPDEEIIENLKVPNGCKINKHINIDKCQSYSIIGGNFRNDKNPIKYKLKKLGLYGLKSEKKFIPKEYLFSSVESRLAIIQGLLDTDGYTNGPCIEFSSSSMQLANDFVFLVRSLGGTATEPTDEKSHYTKNGEKIKCLNKHRTIIKLPNDMNPFRLNKKLNNYNPIQRKNPLKSLIGIKEIGKHEAVCISVDSPDKLYITNGFTLTHNTIQFLEWSNQVHKYTGKDVLIFSPLAVSKQTIREAMKFEMPEVNYCYSQANVKPGINITNYERIDNFDPNHFIGVVCDEVSIIKSFTGSFRNKLIDKYISVPYKLACSATPAPNDYTELGNVAEFLGVMTRAEMLSMFFINDTSDTTANWRLKGHVKNNVFWEWLSSWAVMIQKPSDIGFSDEGYELPKLNIIKHVITYEGKSNAFFVEQAKGLSEVRQSMRETLESRCKKVAEVINNMNDISVAWCNLNDESELLTQLIDKAVEVKGADSVEHKEQSFLDFADNKIKCLVTKPKIGMWGMNWQNCNNLVVTGLSHSFEAFYQLVRRFWRFMQEKEVTVHIVIGEREQEVLNTIMRKEKQMEDMFDGIVKHMKVLVRQELNQTSRKEPEYNPQKEMKLPRFLNESN